MKIILGSSRQFAVHWHPVQSSLGNKRSSENKQTWKLRGKRWRRIDFLFGVFLAKLLCSAERKKEISLWPFSFLSVVFIYFLSPPWLPVNTSSISDTAPLSLSRLYDIIKLIWMLNNKVLNWKGSCLLSLNDEMTVKRFVVCCIKEIVDYQNICRTISSLFFCKTQSFHWSEYLFSRTLKITAN